MTTKSGYKQNKNKWKDGLDDENGTWDMPKPFLTLKFSALILLAIISIVVLKFLVLLTGKPAMLIMYDCGIVILAKAKLASNWLSENYSHLLWPSVKGLSWTVASWTLLYLDSNVPGVNPPVTLSPRQTRFKNTTCHHIGYLVSLAVGVVIFSFSCISLT